MTALRTPTRPAGLLRRHPDFRLLWISEVSGKLGSSATSVIMPLAAISALNATTFQVSLLVAAVWLPWVIIGLPVGAWVDRLPKRPVMVCAAAISLVLFLSIRVAAWTGLFSYAWLLGVSLLTGAAAVFFQVAYTAYLPSLLPAEDLAEGNAKLQGSASAAQVVGLGCGGLLVQVAGPINGLLANAATFAISLVFLLAIRHREPRLAEPKRSRHAMVEEILEGLRLVVRDPWFRSFTMAGAAANLFLVGYQSILPVFLVKDVRLSEGMVGALIAATTTGGILGAFTARRVANTIGSARAILFFAILVTLPILLIPLTVHGPGVLLFVIGGLSAAAGVVANNIIKTGFIQRYCPRDLLGRLTASTSFLNMGAVPVGALIGGALGTAVGTRAAMWILVAGVPATGLLLLLSPIRNRRELPDQPADQDSLDNAVHVDH
ncbi:MFS transporter [Plantactinospora sp. KLBMP9567]|uniref:MFS transporter n=1 Tax=Plantactinospora sp. KLBMP9567 TaxID=3085900 RepID=UPI0029815C59|nr:MFS transporter [Plantactinospora sp. KLBMP9567]MDW5327473.1 MFS transporter [Plantactinospora sp. KLBMP9567]